MELVDTHCHIHSLNYPLDPKYAIEDAVKEGVTKIICVGQDLVDSKLAIDFSNSSPNAWASIGIHPHESRHYRNNESALSDFRLLASKSKVLAVGECGLDYYYDHSDKADQRLILEFQIDVATKSNLPLIFHVREAFDDFWSIIDNFKNVRGVVHSFSSDTSTLHKVLDRGLYVGFNGIMTFSKDASQLDAAKQVPIENIVLETDAPYLTPVPFRGTICQPKHVQTTAEFLAKLRGDTIEDFAQNTTFNAKKLFNL